jgi:tetratricopeptide (TPR) repeat protein
MGLNEAAQEEAERAWRDAPEDPLVNLVRGDTARHDRFGLLYRPSFDRAKAIASFRQGLKRIPDHNWLANALAETLRRNDRGEMESDWSKDVAAGAAVLQGLVDRGLASDANKGLLAEMYTRGRRSDELKRLFEQSSESRDSKDANAQVVHAAVDGGPEAALAVVRRAETPQAEFARLAVALGTFGQLERYDDARKLIQSYPSGSAIEKQLVALRAMVASLQPVPDKVAAPDPESGARAVIAALAHASTPSDFHRAVAPLLSNTFRQDLEASAQRPNTVRIPKIEPRLGWVWLYHAGKCTSVTAGRATRVRCAVPENPDQSITTYWTQDGEAVRLESLGTYRQSAARARVAAMENRLEEAGGWIGWYLDLLMADKNESTAAQLLRDFWGQASRTDAKAVRLAAAMAAAFFTDMARDADPAVLEELERGRELVTGGLKRRLDVRIAEIRQGRKEYALAVERLRPVAESENEAGTWIWLSELEIGAGLLEQAGARVDKALASDAGNVHWGNVKSEILNDTGRYAESAALLARLSSQSGVDTELLTNNLLWSRLLAGTLDDECEREARRITADNKKSVDWTTLHTAAMVMAERGRVQEATQLNQRMQYMRRDTEMESSRWLVRGRLLSLLGCTAQSQAAYARVDAVEPETKDLLRRFQAAPAAKGVGTK